MPNAAEAFADHVARTRYEDIPAAAIARAKVFILDTLGVGLAGSSAQGAETALRVASAWGAGEAAAVWGRRARLPAHGAAFVNAFAVHCQEFDCLHEPAVLHVLATLLPAALAQAERSGGVSGRDLLTAVSVGVDVSAGLGIASTQGLRFFRPATGGGFGAAAAVAKLMGLTAGDIVNAFGMQLAQASGTMQAHEEASAVLPMQVAFNSRAALTAADFAREGVWAPRGSIDGPYGYWPLLEGGSAPAPVLESLGRVWRIAEVSHKPYPSGRATHGAVEGVMALRAQHGFSKDEIDRIVITVPPLTARLVARPAIPDPAPNYARLCCGFAVAKVLQNGRLDPTDFRDAALTDAETFRLAQRVQVVADANPDPNALAPQSVRVLLTDGRSLDWSCAVMLANPARPLSREAHLEKFRRCWDLAAEKLPDAGRATLIDMVDTLETVADVTAITRLLQP